MRLILVGERADKFYILHPMINWNSSMLQDRFVQVESQILLVQAYLKSGNRKLLFKNRIELQCKQMLNGYGTVVRSTCSLY